MPKYKISTPKREGWIKKRNRQGDYVDVFACETGSYYLCYRISGKLVRRVLKADTGETIRDTNPPETTPAAYEAAQKAAHKAMVPIRYADEQSLLLANQAKLSALVAKSEEENADQIWSPLDKAYQALDPAMKRTGVAAGERANLQSKLKALTTWTATRDGVRIFADVTVRVAEDYIEALVTAGHSNVNVNKHLNALKSVWDMTGKRNGAKLNPWHKEHVKRLPQAKSKDRRTLELEEIPRILEASPVWLQNLSLICLSTGMRLGDCSTLECEHIDLRHRGIKKTLNKTAKTTGKAPPYIIPRIPLLGSDDIAFERIRGLVETHKTGPLQPEVTARYLDPKRTDGISKQFQKALKRAGIEIYKEGTGKGTGKRAVVEVSFYSLRHTWASSLLNEGVSESILTEYMGHGAKEMTSHYTDLQKRGAAVAAAGIESFWSQDDKKELPAQWVVDELRKMTAENWESIRDGLIG